MTDQQGQTAPVWQRLRFEAKEATREEPALSSYLNAAILNHDSLGCALGYHLAEKLSGRRLDSQQIREICDQAFTDAPEIVEAAERDLQAVLERDPACRSVLQAFLFFKGFLAIETHRVAHYLWKEGREFLAFHFQGRSSELFQVDIHPAARLGSGLMFDHATGIVIGETATVGDDCSLLHGVTLGGTGKVSGDRHPKIGNGVLLAAGAAVLGNITIGDKAKVAACSVVLKPVPSLCTVAGVPAVPVGGPCAEAAKNMDHSIPLE